MTSHDTTANIRLEGEFSEPRTADPAVRSLALLHELASSLEATQKALLAHDLEGLGQHTRKQLNLREELSRHCAPGVAAGKWAAELRAAAERVLHLGRVQVRLLARGRRSLRIMANRLAEAEPTYSVDPRPSQSLSAQGEQSSCRA